MVYSTARLVPSTSQPSMASLMERTRTAKRLKTERMAQVAQRPITKAAPQQVKRRERPSKRREKQSERWEKPSERRGKPSISPLLSRRLGINILMTVKIPITPPFPPPLVWKRDPRVYPDILLQDRSHGS